MDKTKPIIWMIDGLGPGGAEQLMLSILKTFKADGFNVRVCALQIKSGNPISAELNRIGLSVDLVPIPNLRHPLNLIRILRYLLEHRPQILHTQLEFSDILGTLAAKLLGIPTISTLHTLDELDENKTGSWRLKIRWLVLRKFTDRIIAVSEKTRVHHIRTAKINPKKIVTIYNGIEISRFTKNSEDNRGNTRKSLGLHANKKVIATVAVLRQPKGIQYMLEAMPEILKDIPNAHYLIVGDGAYKPQLLELVDTLGIQGHVTFAGHRTDIPEILNACDLFVLPTLIDALPTVLIEALAASKPIIATNVGGIPEIIEDQINGILVPPGDHYKLVDACVKLLKDQAYSSRLSLAGLQVAQRRFDVPIQTRQIINNYEDII